MRTSSSWEASDSESRGSSLAPEPSGRFFPAVEKCSTVRRPELAGRAVPGRHGDCFSNI
jgi:hypothetical protein